MNRTWKATLSIASGLVLALASWAAAQDDPAPAAAGEKPAATETAPKEGAAKEGAKESNLATQQQQVGDRFRDLEKLLLRMAELTAPTDPRRAALLRQAVAQSKERDLDHQFEQLVELLKQQRLAPAVKNQTEVQQDLVKLLELLLNEDRSKRIESEKARVKEYLRRVNKIIKEQKSVQGETSRDGDTRKLADRQAELSDKTAELAGDIGQDEHRKAAQNSKSPDGQPKEGEPKDGEKKDQPDGDDPEKDGEKKDGEKEADPSKKEGDDKDGEKKDGSKKDGDQKSDKKDSKEPGKDGEPKDGDKKSDGEPKDGQPKDGESKEGQPQEGQPKDGQPQEGQPQNSPPPDPQNSPENQPQDNPAQKRLQQAEQRMKEAQEKLEKAQREEATEKQAEALKELEQAKADLEEILRQLREEETARTLAMLEARFRKMLDQQVEVYEGTKRLDKVPEVERDRDDEIEAGRLKGKEMQIAVEADKALAVLREEGSAVAFPEAVVEMRDDMGQVVDRLGEAKVGEMTQGLEKDIIAALEEMIASLQKAQKDKESKSQPGQPAPSGENEQPLVDTISELKMIRALQMRVNTRTQRYAEMTQTEQTDKPELLDALKKLAEREKRIHQVTRDIAIGRNQ